MLKIRIMKVRSDFTTHIGPLARHLSHSDLDEVNEGKGLWRCPGKNRQTLASQHGDS